MLSSFLLELGIRFTSFQMMCTTSMWHILLTSYFLLGTPFSLLTHKGFYCISIEIHSLICPFFYLCLLFFSDPVVASLAQDIFKELAQIEGCQGPMQMRLIPTLISIMQAPTDKIPSGLCAVSR